MWAIARRKPRQRARKRLRTGGRGSGQAGELKLGLGTGELKGEALVDLLHAGDFVVGFAGRHAVLGNPLGIDTLAEGELAGSAID